MPVEEAPAPAGGGIMICRQCPPERADSGLPFCAGHAAFALRGSLWYTGGKRGRGLRMRGKLLFEMALKGALGIAALALLLFVPAGTLRYWNAWLLMAVLFVPMALAGAVMLRRCPALLQKRLNMKEKHAQQRTVVALSALMCVAGFTLAGLDARLAWTRLPPAVSWAGAALLLLGYALYAEVLRENRFLSRTVEVQAGQTVIDTGLYGVVRHPMYAATLLMFLAMPLVLGSGVALAPFLLYPAILARRIRHEEALLVRELAGYAAYMQKVRYRMIPFLW